MRRLFWVAIVLAIAAMTLCGCDEPDPTVAPVEVARRGHVEVFASIYAFEEGSVCEDGPYCCGRGTKEVPFNFASCAWRWFDEETTYATATLYTQTLDGDWVYVETMVAGESQIVEHNVASFRCDKIFVDTALGNDETGDGTPTAPFKWLTRAERFFNESDLELVEVFVKEEGGWVLYVTWSS